MKHCSTTTKVRWHNYDFVVYPDEVHHACVAPHTITGTVRDLVHADLESEDSVNCLDIVTFGGETPYLIR